MPIDLSSAEDVKCLLQDAMPSNVVLPTTTKTTPPPTTLVAAAPPTSARIDGAAAVVVSPAAPGLSRAADQVLKGVIAMILEIFSPIVSRYWHMYLCKTKCRITFTGGLVPK
jgi:hypothetical protein